VHSHPQPKFIAIRGASGSDSHNINGAYFLREGLINGLPQYQKEDNENNWLVMDKVGNWAVTYTSNKEDNDGQCICHCVKKDMLLPHMTKEWSALDDGVMVLQAEMAVSALVLSLPCFSHRVHWWSKFHL